MREKVVRSQERESGQPLVFASNGVATWNNGIVQVNKADNYGGESQNGKFTPLLKLTCTVNASFKSGVQKPVSERYLT